MPTVLLLRHGRTASNTEGTLAGWTPGVGLDDTGRSQAEALAGRLATVPLVRLVVSPLQRCAETAAVVNAAREQPVQVVEEPDLGECRYGAWTGKTLAELAKEPLWRVVQDHPSGARFPDSGEYASESLAQMSARAVAAVCRHDDAVRAEHGESAVWALVSHGDVIKAILADAAGTHLDSFQRYTADPASLSVVRYTPGRPFVIRVNDTGADLHGLVPTPAEAQRGDATVGGGAGATPAQDSSPTPGNYREETPRHGAGAGARGELAAGTGEAPHTDGHTQVGR